MPEHSPEEPSVAHLSPTDRLVALPSLRLRDARTGAVPRLSTALRLGWRGGALVLRFDCRHRGIVATLKDDNAERWTEDVVEAFVALAEPPFRYLELEVNPLGARFSAIVDSPNLSREGMTVRTFPFPDFKAEVRVREYLWSAVLSISLSEVHELVSTPTGLRDREGKRRPLPGPSTGFETLRANFFRIDRTSGEFSALFPTLADPPDFHRPESFGKFRLRA